MLRLLNPLLLLKLALIANQGLLVRLMMIGRPFKPQKRRLLLLLRPPPTQEWKTLNGETSILALVICKHNRNTRASQPHNQRAPQQWTAQIGPRFRQHLALPSLVYKTTL